MVFCVAMDFSSIDLILVCIYITLCWKSGSFQQEVTDKTAISLSLALCLSSQVAGKYGNIAAILCQLKCLWTSPRPKAPLNASNCQKQASLPCFWHPFHPTVGTQANDRTNHPRSRC